MISLKNIPIEVFVRTAKFWISLFNAIIWISLSATNVAYSAPRTSPSQIPDELLGVWQVSEVHVNTQTGRTLPYGWNSSLLRWRTFDFKTSGITNNTPEKAIPCYKPTSTTANIKVAQALNEIFEYEDTFGKPIVEAYQINIPETLVAKFVHITCSDGSWIWSSISSSNKKDEIYAGGAGVFFIGKDEIIFPWHGETILVLMRIQPNAKPLPSFPCDKARLDSEKAICASHELAGLDRGVTQAYGAILNSTKVNNPNDVKRVRDNQSEWLKMRNACGADESCLSKSMEQRINEIAMPYN